MQPNTASHPRYYRANVAVLSEGKSIHTKVVHIVADSDSTAEAIASHVADNEAFALDTTIMMLAVNVDLFPIPECDALDVEEVDRLYSTDALPFDHPAAIRVPGRCH